MNDFGIGNGPVQPLRKKWFPTCKYSSCCQVSDQISIISEVYVEIKKLVKHFYFIFVVIYVFGEENLKVDILLKLTSTNKLGHKKSVIQETFLTPSTKTKVINIVHIIGTKVG